MTIHAFADAERLARRIAKITRSGFSPIVVHQFPDKETIARVRRPGREAVVVRSLNDPNKKIVEVLLAADALRRAGARRLTFMCPYLAYMRQDKIFRSGEPISQLVLAGLLSANFARVITLEPHLHRIASLAAVFRCEAKSVSAAPVIAEWIGRSSRDGHVVVGPDRESGRLVSEVARLAGLGFAIGVKQRLKDRTVRVKFPSRPRAAGAVIVDDIASSGATVIATIRELHKMGIRTIDLVVVHALFEPGAIARIREAGARRIVSCDTIPHSTNRLEIATLLASAMITK